MKVDGISNTYKANNEDSYGMTEYGFWVMDGASALKQNNYSDEGNDVVWIVQWWEHYLKRNLDKLDKSLQTILEEGIDSLNVEFSKFVDIATLSKLDKVSSAIALVRINGDVVECFILGDVEILIQKKSGSMSILTDESIDHLDRQVMALMASNSNRENEIEFSGFTHEELQLLRQNRMTMNIHNGYAILEHDKHAITRGIYKEYAKAVIADILIVSDGYSSIYNKYHQCKKEDVIVFCKNRGIRKVLDIIRDIESQDAQMIRYKRLKCHDDATAILIEIA